MAYSKQPKKFSEEGLMGFCWRCGGKMESEGGLCRDCYMEMWARYEAQERERMEEVRDEAEPC